MKNIIPIITLIATLYSCSTENDVESPSIDKIVENLCKIEDANLNGWENGYYLNSFILTYSYDYQSETCYYMISDSDNVNSILFISDENGLKGLMNNSKYYTVSTSTENSILYSLNDGQFDYKILPIYKSKTVEKRSLQSRNNLPLYDGLSNLSGWWNYLTDASDIFGDINDKDWGKFFKDINTVIVERGIDGFVNSASGNMSGLIVAPFDMVKGSIEECNKHNYKVMYNEAYAEITEVRKSKPGFNDIYVTVYNANTIPEYLFKYYQPEKNETTRNNVFCGLVAQCDALPKISNNIYQSNEYKIVEKDAKDIYLVYTVPEVPEGLVYNYRPYLKSTRIKNIFGKVDEHFIKYGDCIKVKGVEGEISSFVQFKATTGIDELGTDYVQFSFSVSADIPSSENIEEWGVYLKYDDGQIVKYPSSLNAKIHDVFDITDQSFNYDEFDELDFYNFLAIKKIKMGLYKKYENPTGTFDYLTEYMSDPQYFDLIYDEKPSISFVEMDKVESSVVKESDDKGIYYLTRYQFQYNVIGHFWLKRLHYSLDSGQIVNKWDPIDNFKNGLNIAKGRCHYWNSATYNTYFTVELKNSDYIYSDNYVKYQLYGLEGNFIVMGNNLSLKTPQFNKLRNNRTSGEDEYDDQNEN